MFLVIDQLADQCQQITTDFFADDYGFEELAVQQFLFRWNMFNFASVAGYVKAKDLFYGGHFTVQFANNMFALEPSVLSLCSAKPQGIWATNPKTAQGKVRSERHNQWIDIYT